MAPVADHQAGQPEVLAGTVRPTEGCTSITRSSVASASSASPSIVVGPVGSWPSRLSGSLQDVEVAVGRCRRPSPSRVSTYADALRLMMSGVGVGGRAAAEVPHPCWPPQPPRAARTRRRVLAVLVRGGGDGENRRARRAGHAQRSAGKRAQRDPSERASSALPPPNRGEVRLRPPDWASQPRRTPAGLDRSRPGRCRSPPAPRRESRSRSRALSRRPPRAFSPAPPRRAAAARSARAPGPGTRPPTRPPRP